MKEKVIKRTLLGLLSLSPLFVTGCLKREFLEEEEKSEEKQEEVHGHGHGHDGSHAHDHTPHHGIVTPLQSGSKQVGFVELKLHDDKGDLELWLAADQEGTKPMDLPLDSVITVTFPELNKSVELRIRDNQNNEDESGKANIRANKTNYFIFPGDTGVDASFLVGKDFSSNAVISFSTAEGQHGTTTFELKPHTH